MIHPSTPAILSFPTRRSSDLSGRVFIHQERQIVDQIPGNKKNVHKNLHLRLRNHQGQITPVDRGDLSFGDIGLTYPDRKSTRLNSSHVATSYAVFCLKKKDQL